MSLRWTRQALGDLERLYEFLETTHAGAAARAVNAIVARVRRIPAQPRLGALLAEFAPREVRRVVVRNYEVRYEIAGMRIYVLRIFHTREQR